MGKLELGGRLWKEENLMILFIIKARQERERIEQARHSDEVVEKELKQSIYDDVVTIFGIPVIFKEFDIMEDKAVIRMPSDFIARSEDEIASVYFLGSKPQYVSPMDI